MPHRFFVPKDYFRSQYFEGCDLLVQELSDHFEQKEVIQPVLSIESQLIKAANGEDSTEELRIMTESVFLNDLSIDKLERQLAILVDVIHVGLPTVKVTCVHTICEAMQAHANGEILSEIHKLIQLYLTIPITSATSE